ncbi:hypothetical protein [Kitasatospora sp. A2-31]|uniref:hypothetical protein n=1 Tax=Kitasatospora sp. A2-31 TaxID=2916414 RepID=UPI001EE7C46A|nr:hypothetical protein [Kitasatospora sp. A2-31]MCG6493313.1 hypothetical protein [Kitasatospora sp. A2-31]
MIADPGTLSAGERQPLALSPLYRERVGHRLGSTGPRAGLYHAGPLPGRPS